jgi:hypothetical protein
LILANRRNCSGKRGLQLPLDVEIRLRDERRREEALALAAR